MQCDSCLGRTMIHIHRCLTTERSRMHPLNESTKMDPIPTNCRPTSIDPIFARVSRGSTDSRSALIILFKFNLTWKSMRIQRKKMRSLSEEFLWNTPQPEWHRSRSCTIARVQSTWKRVANIRFESKGPILEWSILSHLSYHLSYYRLAWLWIVVQNEEMRENMTNSNRRFWREWN